MDLTNPLRSLARPLQAEVLRVLSATTGTMSGRQVHQVVGVGSVEGVRGSLQQLVAAGLVDVEQRPGLSLYRLNRDHLLAAPLLAVLDARTELLRRVGALVEQWPLPVRHASVFGSTARSDGGLESDVDVLLVPGDERDAASSRWEVAVDDLSAKVERWTGNPAHVHTVTQEQVTLMSAAGDPLMVSWRAEGRLLAGDRLDALVRG